MLCTVVPIWMIGEATEYWQFLVLGLFVGLAGGSFSVGIAYCARWFDRQHQGFAMGIFGAGNSGAALTKFVAPAVLGFTSAFAAYGGFFIPKSYGTSISMTGGPEAALYVFIVFYLTCIVTTWWYYSRKNAEMPC